MHDHSGGLIDDAQRRILVDDGHRERFGDDRGLNLDLRLDAHLLATQHLVLGPRNGAIEANRSRLDPTLQSLPRILGQEARQSLVQAQTGQLLGNIDFVGAELDGQARVLVLIAIWLYWRATASQPGNFLGALYNMSVNGPVHGLARGLTLALCLTSALLTGCQSSSERRLLATNPAAIYKVAHDRMEGGDYRSAINLMEALMARFPFTEQARQSHLDLIYVYYKDGQSESASDAADTFIRENPINSRIDYAYYMKGMLDFERTPNILERVFRADLTKRPPVTARKSFDSFRRVVQDYPKSAYAHDSLQRMIYLRNRLADYDVHVAEYYMRRGAYAGASQRAAETIEDYPGAPETQEALKILIEAEERLGLTDKADQARAVYAANFSGSTPELKAEKDRRWWQIW